MKDYIAPANLLSSKTIIVTGAANGIGKATAKSYARHGATVILMGLRGFMWVKFDHELIYDSTIVEDLPVPGQGKTVSFFG